MSDPDPTPPSFPNIKNKLHAPTKKSAFEKAKAEAEAKRLREEAETAAVYEDFIKSFSQDDSPGGRDSGGGRSGPPGRGGFGAGGRGGGIRPPPPSGPAVVAGQRRHFTAPTGAGGGPTGGLEGRGKVGGFSLGGGGRGGPGGSGGPFDGPGRKRNLDSYMDESGGGGGPTHLSEREKARRLRDGSSGLLAFESHSSVTGTTNTNPEQIAKKEDYFPQEDEEEDSDAEEKEQPKPTVQLTNLPPTFTKDDVRGLFRDTNPNMVVDSIRLIPAVPHGPSTSSLSSSTSGGGSGAGNAPVRKAASAIVTLSTETPSSEIDALTSTLQNRYLGYGFWLSISRQLASAALSINQPFPALLTASSRGTNTSNPFGAKSLAPKPVGGSGGGPGGGSGGHSRAPPPSYTHPRGFAPPSSYSSGGRSGGITTSGGGHGSNSAALQVHVHPPTNLRTLKLIHKTVENVFTHGPEFEALLMSNETVRKDERWSFLFDTRSEGHAYYRWRLWEVLSGAVADSQSASSGHQKGVEMFEGPNQPLWIPPRRGLRYEWAGGLQEIVDDPEYRSDGDLSGSGSEDDDHHHNPHHAHHHHGGRRDKLDSSGPLPVGGLGLDSSASGGKDARSYLGPLKRGKLMWLVSRVPPSTTKVRRGDIARVMAFAIENAAAAEEVVEVLVGNVVRPLSFQRHVCEPNSTSLDATGNSSSSKENTQTTNPSQNTPSQPPPPPPPPSDDLLSGAKITALYLLSDVLSNSSLGIRNAWRYRTLVEQKLREAKVMESLGRTYRSESWGRIRKEKFRRLVVAVLGLWESWNVFPQGTHDEFVRGFMGEGKDEAGAEGKERDREGKDRERERDREPEKDKLQAGASKKSRWKTVEAVAQPVEGGNVFPAIGAFGGDHPMPDPISSFPATSHPGEAGHEAEDEDEDVDGVPMQDSDNGDDDEEDVDGVPLIEDDDGEEGEEGVEEGEGVNNSTATPITTTTTTTSAEEQPARMGFGGMTFGVRAVGMAPGPPVKRKRPKAEDMFADEEDEEAGAGVFGGGRRGPPGGAGR